MAFETIRLSPSGAPIKNDQGAELKPGPGFVLRQDDDSIAVSNPGLTSGAATVITTDLSEGGTPLLVQLANPKPTLRYRLDGSVAFQNTNTDTTTVTMTVELQVSIDDGMNWAIVSGNQSVQTLPPDGTVRVWCGQTLELGSFFGITDSSPSVQFRVLATAAGSGSEVNALGSSGNAQLLLQECA